MSAWAIFSMMGFYPDCPGSPYYTFTLPRFDEVKISLDPEFWGKKELNLQIKGNVEHSEKGTPAGYIRSINAGGKTSAYRISHRALIDAGTISFTTKKQQ